MNFRLDMIAVLCCQYQSSLICSCLKPSFVDVRLELTTGTSATITPLRSVNTQWLGCSKDTPTTSESEQSTHTGSANHPACLTPSLHWIPPSLGNSMVGLFKLENMSAIEMYTFTGFLLCPCNPYLSVAKKLGGKLDVVSFNDDLDGEFFFTK